MVIAEGMKRVKPWDSFIAKAQTTSSNPAIVSISHDMAVSIQSRRAVPDLKTRNRGEDVASRLI
ncbi:hypothetical protein GCM10023157_13640 [Gluconacetobacter asukensis]